MKEKENTRVREEVGIKKREKQNKMFLQLMTKHMEKLLSVLAQY